MLESFANKFDNNNHPISEDIANELKAQIFSGKLRPGDRLVERQLARDFNASRQPVRDALDFLEKRELVVRLPTKGVVVAPLSPKDLDDLFVVRESLEVLAALLACKNVMAGADASTLKQLIDQNHTALLEKDDETAFRTNAEFHEEILVLADNEMLASILNPILLRMHLLSGGMRNLEVVHAEHIEMYEAIVSGDLNRLESCARSHANKLSVNIKTIGSSEN